MKSKGYAVLAGIVLLILSGCEVPRFSQDSSSVVTGSVSMVPKSEAAQPEDGGVCVGSLDSGSTLNGSKVVLRDATGAVIGVSLLEGYSGELSEESQILLGQGIYRSADGLCHWDFSIENVDSDTQFFEVEVVGVEAEGLVFRRDEVLLEGLTVFLGGESIEQATDRLEAEAELTREITCAINPDSILCPD